MSEPEKQTHTKSFTFDAILKSSPEKELVELAKLASDGRLLDWKSAIIMTTIYLERYGLDLLLQHVKVVKNSGEQKELIERFERINLDKTDLYTIAKFLFDFGLIGEKQHKIIDVIREERNEIIHRLNVDELTEKYNPRLNSEANNKYGKMINDTKEIISSLKKSSKVG